MPLFEISSEGTCTCPHSGLTVFSPSQWRDVRFNDALKESFFQLGESIFLSAPSGYGTLKSVQGAATFYDRIRGERLPSNRPYVLILDMSDLKGVTWQTRKFYIDYLKKQEQLQAVIFYGLSPLLHFSFALARSLHLIPFKAVTVEGYSKAIELALEYSGATRFAPQTPRLGLTVRQEAGREVVTAPHWSLDLGGYRVQFEVIEGKILHSRSQGYFEERHVAPVARFRETVAAEMGLEQRGFLYLVIGTEDLAGGSRKARRLYMDNLKQWHSTRPFRLCVLYGANWFMRAAASLAGVYLPFRVRVAEDLDHALKLIEAEEKQRKPSLPKEKSADRVQGYVNDLLEGLNRIDWEAPGLEESFLPAPNHPFRPVFDAITLIKGEFDEVMEERLQAQEALEEERKRLQKALDDVKTLRGIVPICASCKKIRDDKGYWKQVEVYVRDHTEAEFSHGICPECLKKLYPEFA